MSRYIQNQASKNDYQFQQARDLKPWSINKLDGLCTEEKGSLPQKSSHRVPKDP